MFHILNYAFYDIQIHILRAMNSWIYPPICLIYQKQPAQRRCSLGVFMKEVFWNFISNYLKTSTMENKFSKMTGQKVAHFTKIFLHPRWFLTLFTLVILPPLSYGVPGRNSMLKSLFAAIEVWRFLRSFWISLLCGNLSTFFP